MKISEHSVLKGENREVNRLLHLLSDLERISDHAVNLVESAEEMRDKALVFSEEIRRELSVMIAAIGEITTLSLRSLRNRDAEAAECVEPLEQVIDGLRQEIKKRHVIRLQNHMETIEQGFVLNDILTDLERVADHCSNIAGLFLNGDRYHDVGLHQSLREYRSGRMGFETKRKEYEKKYRLNS